MAISDSEAKKIDTKPIRVLLLDDRADLLILRAAILRQNGYEAISSSSIEDAESKIDNIDIAILDYHLGEGKFGTSVAETLREKRPQVPIIILSATLERKFGGVEDMHLLKGHSSVDDLLAALRSFEAKRRGKPVVVDARDFFYSRISMAMGDDVVLEIMDDEGNWQYVNDTFAKLYDKRRFWFVGKNLFDEFPELRGEWEEIIQTVANTRETYVDRSFRGLPNLPKKNPRWVWNVLAFPLRLHDDRSGVVLSARVIEKKS
ncbi:MAG: response regulator receiver protein [Acidobacteriaceae bacterium]|nr:response regulator receiver protein [Acidobacteriaceae bacterium]